MLGYRMFFSVAENQSAVAALALEQMHSWLRSKGYDADRLVPSEWVGLAQGVEGLRLEHHGQDGSETVRVCLVEERDPGRRWVSELTVHVPGAASKDSWVWLDVDAPEFEESSATRKPLWTGTPRIVRGLLDVMVARDGVARLGAAPQVVTPDELPAVLEAIRDQNRRGIVFVAGSDEEMPLLRWKTMVERLLWETVGLAAGYVLDAEATSLLRSELGPKYSVAPGTVRSFLPAVDVTSEIDSIRHRVLSTQRIVREDGRRVARLLGWKAREVAIEERLPAAAARVSRLLSQQADQLLLNRLTLPSIDGRIPRPALAPDVEREVGDSVHTPVVGPAAPESDAPEHLSPSGRPIAEDVENYLALRSVVQGALGIDDVNSAALDEIARLAALGRQAEKAQAAFASRLIELQSRLAEAEQSRHDTVRRLEDEQLEHAAAVQELVRARELIRHLRSLLARTGEAEAAWTSTPDDNLLLRPSSFLDLLKRISELAHVKFTGDPDIACELDQRDPMGTWAAKTWEVLLALEDYARLSVSGQCDRGVDGYLRHTPDGCHGFSANRHARDESEDVKNNPRFRGLRVFPVPADIDPSRKIFMGAHFKIAQSGMISPRLHYHDGTARTGCVYVGYIGPHLQTKQTN